MKKYFGDIYCKYELSCNVFGIYNNYVCYLSW